MLTKERLKGGRFVTDFDSSVNTVRAVGSFLNGESHSGFSMGPGSRLLSRLMSAPPDRVRAAMFRGAGFSQGIPLNKVREIDIDLIDEWAVQQYPSGQYPVVVVGSTSGAAVHIAAALGAPFLPQTNLVALRDLATHVDAADGAMTALAPMVKLLAENNPRVAVYHMHDPAQDRPMVEAMAYMRLKRRALGPVYEQFLEENLAPGGVVLQVENSRTWRVHTVGERGYFQFGCLGGLSEDEYHEGSERITTYLEQEDAPVRTWETPEMDDRVPEAEWGFDPVLGEDIAGFAAAKGFTVRRLVSDEPQHQSPFAADLFRWWYGEMGRPTNQLLVQSYAQWDPFWTMRTGSVPFWLRFNMGTAYDELAEYLAQTEPYDVIYANLFSQGIESPDVVPVERWRELVERHAAERGEIIGVDEDTYPMDAGSSTRYERAFADLPTREELPEPLTIDQVDRFVRQSSAAGRTYSGVEWI
jgi:hypothetical protein